MVSSTYGANSSLMGLIGEYLVKFGICEISGVWTECLSRTDCDVNRFIVLV